MKKAISAATSAALLASLLATAVAPSAFAAVTIGNVGSIAQGSTSATAATFTFTENSAAALATTGTMTVTITPKAPVVGTVSFVGTPTLTGNTASLGATITSTANSFTITITGHDDLNIENLVVGGLKIKASADATPGAIVATITGTAGVLSAFVGGTATATGKLAQAYGPTTTSWIVAVDSTSPCIFSGTNSVTVGAETLGGVTVSANNVPVAGQQTFTTNAMGTNHLANEVVTQTVANCTPAVLASPGTVAAALTFDLPSTPTVFPGENFAPAGNLTLHENAATGIGYIAAGAVITAKIATAGVTFSVAPKATAYGNATVGNTISAPDNRAAGFLFTATPTNSNPALGILSADKTSVSWTVKTASTELVRLVIDGIQYNVASTVAGGTSIDVGVTVSGDLVQPASRTNAVVARPVTATSTSTTVYIGETNQAAGTVSIVENTAGTFTDGTGNYNTFEVCLATGEAFSVAPSATVSAGDLQLRSGLVAVAPGTAVVGTPFTSNSGNPQCFYWTVWSASTAASTIQISGIKVDVPSGMAAGNTNAAVGIGSVADFDVTNAIILKIATRVFRNQVTVTALTQPFIPAGALDAPVGNLQIAETANGQLKQGEFICVAVLPRTTNGLRTQDTFIKALNTADRPVLTGENGIVLDAVEIDVDQDVCNPQRFESNSFTSEPAPFGYVKAFGFEVLQQSVTGNGKITISNIKYSTTADAPLGPIAVNVWGFGGSPTLLQFQSSVSNAKIGTEQAVAVTTSGTALGATKTGPFSISTKLAKLGKYVTWKFSGGAALVGKSVQIFVATKNSAGKWSAFAPLTARRVDASGNAYFWWKTSSKAWISVRAGYLGTLSVATQARWL
jgi:hypothetical protein